VTEKRTTSERRSAAAASAWADPETWKRHSEAQKRAHARRKKARVPPDVRKERKEAAQIALQAVHDCNTCRKILRQLFLVKPAAIETAIGKYHKHVAAALADPTISVQANNPCQCCHLAPVVGTHGNSKYCIPCKIVREEESKREQTRRRRAEQRGEAPVEEVRPCVACKGELDPNPRTGKIDRRRQRCLECTEAYNLKGRAGWKKKKSAKARQQTVRYCPGLKIDEGERIRPCGLRFVPNKTMHQKYCSKECEVLTNSIRHTLDPQRRKYYRDLATKMRERAWRPDDWDEVKEQLDRTVGFLLLSNRHIKNLEIGALLDEMGWKCPYEKTWKSALSRPGSAANYITDIRKWVKVPGKTIAPKPRSITH
jgi:hypothetical protein